jgi:hypothetical protein
VVWTVVCILICTLVSGGMDGCIYVNMYIGIWWYGRLYVCLYVHWYLVVWTVVCMTICTLVSGGMDGCMYVNMYIGICWYGPLYVC